MPRPNMPGVRRPESPYARTPPHEQTDPKTTQRQRSRPHSSKRRPGGTPIVPQDRYQCRTASEMAALRSLALRLTENRQITRRLGPRPEMGTTASEGSRRCDDMLASPRYRPGCTRSRVGTGTVSGRPSAWPGYWRTKPHWPRSSQVSYGGAYRAPEFMGAQHHQ